MKQMCLRTLATHLRPSFARQYPSEKQREQGMPGARCTRGLVCPLRSTRDAHEHTGSAEAVRHPLRGWLYGLYRALLGEPCTVAPVASRDAESIIGRLDASVGAPGPRDFAVREMCRSSYRAHQRPPHPASRSVTIGLTPLIPRRDGAKHTRILISETKNFCGE